MKRLLSIVLMNAWGGLRQKASLPTMSLVGISVMALLVVSTVTADASPHTNIPVVTTVANAVHAGITGPISSILGDSTPPKPAPSAPSKKPKIVPNETSGSQQPTNTTANAGNSSSAGNSATNTSGMSGQPNNQPATVTIAASSLQCTPNAASSPNNSYTLSVASAQVNFQTPPTAGGTITYAWDTLSNSQTTLGTTISQQQFSAGQQSVALNPPSGSSSIYTTTSGTTSFSFRLHVTGPFDVTSNWISVTATANGSCPASNNN